VESKTTREKAEEDRRDCCDRRRRQAATVGGSRGHGISSHDGGGHLAAAAKEALHDQSVGCGGHHRLQGRERIQRRRGLFGGLLVGEVLFLLQSDTKRVMLVQRLELCSRDSRGSKRRCKVRDKNYL